MLHKSKKLIFLGLVLVISLSLVGCSEDLLTQGGEDYQIPLQVIKGIGSKGYDAVFEAEGGSDYYWEVKPGTAEGSFNDPTAAKPEFIADKTGKLEIRVTIDHDVKQWHTVEVVDNQNETEYYEGGFHVVVPTEDTGKKGYLAAGFNGGITPSDPKLPYSVKTKENGLTVWDTTRNEAFSSMDGRFYGVQDIVYPLGGDKYYLVGYRAINNGNYESYAVKLNNKGEKEDEWHYGEPGKNIYLREGLGIKEDSSDISHMVAVGNVGITAVADPYIIKMNISNNTDINDSNVETFRPKVEKWDDDYYNLRSIVETDDGYIVAGFVGSSSTSTQGALIKLNKNFEVVKSNNDYGVSKLYRIKKVSDTKFVIVGSGGYVAEVDENLNLTEDIKLASSLAKIEFRDVLVDNGNYVLVGTNAIDGIVAKVASDGSFKIVKRGMNLFSISKANDGNYLIGGTAKNHKAYLAKLDANNGSIKLRVE